LGARDLLFGRRTRGFRGHWTRRLRDRRLSGRLCDRAVADRGGTLFAARSALRACLTSHKRVSRCAVCWPHQRQYFFSSTRSGVFRFDLYV